MARRGSSPEERFWASVDQGDDCWVWRASRTSRGYGTFSVEGKITYVHRFSYELHVGPIPEGLVIDHLCENQPCVNPEHLEPVTHAENLARYRERRTHCKWGHELTPENTYEHTGPSGTKKRCRECLRKKQVRARERQCKERADEPKAPRTHCKNGHEYTDANTAITPEGWRRCRDCDREKQARYRAQREEAIAA